MPWIEYTKLSLFHTESTLTESTCNCWADKNVVATKIIMEEKI